MVSLRLAGIAIILIFLSSTNGSSQFLTYMQPDYEGPSSICVDNSGGCNVSDVISIKKIIGTCGELLDSKSGKLFYINEDNPNTDYYYEGLLSTCHVHKNDLKCPDGTFVKEIEWDAEFNLTRGIKITCNKPESTDNDGATILHSHPKATFSSTQKMKCGAFSEITIVKNTSMEADVDFLDIGCLAGFGQFFDKTLKCQSITALSGMTFSIETKTNYIKSTNIICSDIPDIAAVCKAEDAKLKLAFRSGYSNTLRNMPIVKKIGIGLKPSLSDSEKNEYEFYRRFGPENSFSLSTNFRENIGKGEKTGYDWRSAPKSTWQREHNITIEVEVSPFCETELTEIVGSCSYMEVRPYHLERVDNCNGQSIRTIEQIPHNINRRSYRSEIPDSVKHSIV